MSIFNSLGSNYSLSFAGLAGQQLFKSQPKNKELLREKLEKDWSSRVILTAKGRDAIELALKNLNLQPGDQVLTQAFSCMALEKAIERAGFDPIFVDCPAGRLNPSTLQLKQALEQADRAKAVIVQHSLGYPAEIDQIKQFCLEQGLYLIEDLAQAYGAKDLQREQLGVDADCLVLSFGKDKILDAIQGGAVIAPKLSLSEEKLKVKFKRSSIYRDLVYPLLTWFIRKTHWIGLGRLVHSVAKKLDLMPSSVMTEVDEVSALPGEFATLALTRLQKLDQQLAHRTKLAHIYYNQLKSNKNLKIPVTRDQIRHGTNLRFPVLVKNPSQLVEFLAKKGIYLSDRWYQKPSDSGSLKLSSSYQAGSCPHAEKLTKRMVNLPTHQAVQTDDVLHISQLINQFI